MNISRIHIPILNRFICLEKQLPYFITKCKKSNHNVIIDYAVEGQNNVDLTIKNRFIKQVYTYPDCFHAIKCSMFGTSKNDWYSNINDIIVSNPNTKYLIDAENVAIQDDIYNLTDKLISKYNKDKVVIYKTYQMYRKDTLDLLHNDLVHYQRQNLYLGVKLVRGAYLNQDCNTGILCSNKRDTDTNYNNAINMLVKHKSNHNNINYILATHNTHSILHHNTINNTPTNTTPINTGYHTATLLGFTPKYNTHNHLVYLPYGDITNTVPYLMRRLYENYDILNWL